MQTDADAPAGSRPAPTDVHPDRAPGAGTIPVVTLVVVLLLVLLVTVGSAFSSPWEITGGGAQEPLPLPTPVETIAPPSVPAPDEESDETATPVKVALLVLAGLLATGVAVYLLVRAVRRRRHSMPARRTLTETPRSPGDDTRHGTVTVVPELRTGIQTATARLRGATTSTDAIIAAWLALEESAEASGAKRTAAQTPTEYTVAVLDTTPASPGAVARLLHLYHLARFTTTPLTAQDVTEAETCLTDLARSLAPTGPRHPQPTPSEPTTPEDDTP